MTKMKRITAVFSLILVLASCLLTGCGSGGLKDLTVEPFDMDWGVTQQEAEELLKCVYGTNARDPNTIYVLNSNNGNTLQAFGTTPSMIIYTFNLVAAGSDTPRLGAITICFPEEDYDKVLADLDKKCGKRYYENTQWGTENSDVYLFDNGIISIVYSDSPITDPDKLDESSRDRVIALRRITYSSQYDIANGYLDMFNTLCMYSTAETDFVTVDNSR